MDVFLETERLRLRRFTAADVDLLVALDSDPEVMRFLSGGPATPREVIAERVLPRFIASYERHDGLGYWAAHERPAGGFVGWFALHPNDGGPADEFELGYRLRRDRWGMGLATEGSLALLAEGFRRGARRIFAETYQDNLGSRRVMEKLGMRLVREFKVSDEALASETFAAGDPSVFPGNDVEYEILAAGWRGSGERIARQLRAPDS